MYRRISKHSQRSGAPATVESRLKSEHHFRRRADARRGAAPSRQNLHPHDMCRHTFINVHLHLGSGIEPALLFFHSELKICGFGGLVYVSAVTKSKVVDGEDNK